MSKTQAAIPSQVISLDGDWLLAPDPRNVGRDEQWWKVPRGDAKPARVPGIIQTVFPGYHGVAWYWRDFEVPRNPHAGGRALLRFWAVDYKASVWLNGVLVGEHEGAESPFIFDVTDAIRPGATNRLAVRVVNPTHEPIDGLVLTQVPHRNKALPYSAGSAWNQGGIWDSVELLLCAAVRVEDIFVRADPKTGEVRVQANVHNAGGGKTRARLEFTVAPAASGQTVAAAVIERELPPGDTLVEAWLRVEGRRLWQLNDPFLYRASVRVSTEGSTSFDEQSVRFGFRDFRFEDGYFRLNGKRLYLRCSHTGNCCPIGLEVPHDPDILRRDLIYVKAMGFNAIRFIAGVAKRYQLDLCDELGLMVYEESYASWCLGESGKMAERYDESVLGMVKRDRNHPSVVIWGLLNETPDGAVFRHAAAILGRLRALDDTRMVMLNSGRWDLGAGVALAGLQAWRLEDRVDPCVTRNSTDHPLSGLGITWSPGQVAFHPGANGEYAVVRWTAPVAGTYRVTAAFRSIAEHATTDVHVLHNGRALFDGLINVGDGGPACEWQGEVEAAAGDILDFACGWGNGNYGGDTTALAVTITAPDGKSWDVAADFSVERNPNGAWSYGMFAPGPVPDPATFTTFPLGETLGEDRYGSLSNPGSDHWEPVLADQHVYPRVPHTAAIIRDLRTRNGGGLPLFISEYGIGSAVDLWRTVRHYERLDAADVEDARFYRDKLERFLADWDCWKLAEVFGRPEDYFRACLTKMAGQRLLGMNAIRSNPAVVGYSLTGTVDQGMTGEGLFTTWREFKPGTVDAIADAWALLRLCLFAEPVNVYRGAKVRLEAVLANEDALPPGEYPVRLQVFGPGEAPVLERRVVVTIPGAKGRPEPPFATPVFTEEIPLDVPTGRYRFVASFEEGAAACGGETEFYVADPADMPPVEAEVTLWGEDAALAQWLADHGIRTRPFDPAAPARREVLLACSAPPVPGGAEAFADLARRIARGSTCVFLSPEVFRKGDDPVGWLPLVPKGTFAPLHSWLYLKDEWARRHPIFDGLPAGGLMDYTYYRELIPDAVFSGQEAPAEAVAGAIKASQDYSSGLIVAVYNLGAGRFVLNSLLIRENLGTHPAAEHLLRNMLRFAARDLHKPPADLPAGFDAHLKQFGYR